MSLRKNSESNSPIKRALTQEEAAEYVGLRTTKFRNLVKEGRMPLPRQIDTRQVWDIKDLDAAFESLPVLNKYHRTK